jgi:hypothetical protein
VERSALRFHHFFCPSSAVGVDFFQILQISDSIAGVLICDVMGHGVRAALVAAILRALVEELRARATDPRRTEPWDFPNSETNPSDDVCIGMLPGGRFGPRRITLCQCGASDSALRASALRTAEVDEVKRIAVSKNFADDVCLITMEIDHLRRIDSRLLFCTIIYVILYLNRRPLRSIWAVMFFLSPAIPEFR